MIEDPEGTRGWMLVSLLSDRRTAIVKGSEPRMFLIYPEGNFIEAGEDNRHYPGGMLAPAGVLVALSVLLTVVAGPLYALCERAAHDLHERTPYMSSVLTEEAP